MKRLLAMLTALWVALTNNIGYQASPGTAYKAGEYFIIEEGMAPDYRSLYDTVPVAGGNNNCYPGNHSTLKSLHVYSGTDLDTYEDLCAMTKEDAKEWKAGNIPDDTKYSVESERYLYSPYSGKITTSPLTSDGTNMTIQFTTSSGKNYVVNYHGMKCWYCDVTRDLDAIEGESFHTFTDWGSFCTVKSGTFIGIAGEDCYIEIQDSSGAFLTMKEFYTTPK